MTASTRACSSLIRSAFISSFTSFSPSALSLFNAFPPAESPESSESLSHTSGWDPSTTLEQVVITVHGQSDKVTRSAAKLARVDDLHCITPLFSGNECTTWRIFCLHKAV